MDKLTKIYFRSWRPVLSVLTLALIAYLLYFHRLGSLLPGYSAPEQSTLTGAASWHNIANNPINAPYKSLIWFLTAFTHHHIVMTRVVAAGFGVGAVMLFYAIIRPWYSYRISFLSTLLFATSAGFLHFARLGTPQVLQMSVLLFITAVLWYRRADKHQVLTGYTVAALFALLLYVPGMVWLELFGLFLLWPGTRRSLRDMQPVHPIGWCVTFLAFLTPLLAISIRSPHILLLAAGLPQDLHNLTHIGTNLLDAIMSVGVRSNGDPLFWVGHAPLLNAAELVLGALGCYFYLVQQRTVRAMFLTGSVVISLVLISFGGPVGFATLVPLLYLFIAHGLSNLMAQWFTVFPRNPIARGSGIAVICLMLFFSVLYQTRVYFVAWPHTTATRQAFDLPQP